MLTRKWFFARVRTEVTLEKPRPREAFSAQRTFTWQSVRPDVHLQGSERDISFIAEFTVELLFNMTGTMELLVFG